MAGQVARGWSSPGDAIMVQGSWFRDQASHGVQNPGLEERKQTPPLGWRHTPRNSPTVDTQGGVCPYSGVGLLHTLEYDPFVKSQLASRYGGSLKNLKDLKARN